MKHLTTTTLAAVLALGAFGSGAASASERTYLNPQPLPPICALARTGSDPFTFVRAMIVRYIVLPIGGGGCPRF